MAAFLVTSNHTLWSFVVMVVILFLFSGIFHTSVPKSNTLFWNHICFFMSYHITLYGCHVYAVERQKINVQDSHGVILEEVFFIMTHTSNSLSLKSDAKLTLAFLYIDFSFVKQRSIWNTY